jgi:hypothetical protein
MPGLLDYFMSPYYAGGIAPPAFDPQAVPVPFPQGGDPMAGTGSGNSSPFPQGGDPMAGAGSGNNGGLPATPASIPPQWGALYPSSLNGEADQAQQARDAAASVLARRFRGASHAPAPEAPAPAFGAGAVPFGFAGPGSMNVDPSQIAPAPAASPFAGGAKPVPFAGGPVTSQPPAGAPTDISSVNRDRAPDDFIPVGDYQMPAFRGEAPAVPAAAPVAAPAPARAAPFSLAGSGAGDGGDGRLMKATRGFMGNMSAGPLGALMGGLGALVTGQNTDPTSIAAEQNSMTAKALLEKGASPEEVRAARYNPALMKALVEQHWGKDKWAVVQTGEDDSGRKTYMQQNQVDGTLRDIPRSGAQSGAPVQEYVAGPDGKPIPIPPTLTGAARKEFLKHVAAANADAATGKQTETQGKAGSFAARMELSQKDIAGLENQGLDATQAVASRIPGIGNYLQSADHQRYETAKSAFISAKLRRESGAAIHDSEYQREERELFPRPGDDASVVQQKARLRAAALEQMKREAGPGYRSAAPAASASGKTAGGITWSVQ